MGPPMSDTLVSIIELLFSVEEARLGGHLSFVHPKTLGHIARKSGASPGSLAPILEEMVRKKTIIRVANRYMLYPLIPGIFEVMLKNGDDDAWHAAFAELINDLVDTGYMGDYLNRPINAIRNIPVRQAVNAGSIVADTDLVSELIDSHEHFAVYNICPCRHSMRLTGHECKRASADEGCLAFGDYSLGIEPEGSGRTVSKEEMLDIVADRRAKELVFFTSNVRPSSPTAICTCCDCCCRALKIHNSFSKNLVAPSHVNAAVDERLCNNCGRCVKACNTHAHSLNNKKHVYNHELCVGCGNCAVSCGSNAITMVENELYKPPSGSYPRLILKMLPPILLTGAGIKLRRLFPKK
jgi:NAD-dependent dihydropyrimidine dehydrogenase PreA subunit